MKTLSFHMLVLLLAAFLLVPDTEADDIIGRPKATKKLAAKKPAVKKPAAKKHGTRENATFHYDNSMAGAYDETAVIVKKRNVIRTNPFSVTTENFKKKYAGQKGMALVKYHSAPNVCIFYPTLVPWKKEEKLIKRKSSDPHPNAKLVQLRVNETETKKMIGRHLSRHCKEHILTVVAKPNYPEAAVARQETLELILAGSAEATIELLHSTNFTISYKSPTVIDNTSNNTIA